MVQVTIASAVTEKAGVQSQSSPCGIYGGQGTADIRCSPRTSVSLS
jgi:hypothetical protein